MPIEKRSANIELVATLDSKPSDRAIHIVVTPVDDAESFVADGSASFVIRCWREGAAIIRGKISHASGAEAYFQGGEALAQMVGTLRLHIERTE